jgi:glucose-6-phosphate isomerase
MSKHGFEEIRCDPSGSVLEDHGLSADDLTVLAPRLEAARAEVLADLELLRSGSEVPQHKQPLDAGFIDLPERLLGPEASELNRIVAAAGRLAGLVDRVVVIGIGGSYMGARALFEACSHPYHNELTRAQRKGRPRLYFAGNNVDNDAAQGLLDLLDDGARWGIIVVSKSGATLEPAVAFRLFLTRLQQRCNRDEVARLVLPVTGYRSKLFKLAEALGCENIFEVPDQVGGRYSILSAVGLLPAAIVGLDVRGLLEGAARMNARFRDEPVGRNPVLDWAGVCNLLEDKRGATIRVLSAWDDALEAVGLWYDQLLSESLGKEGRGATPLTAVSTRDLHSRGQQHQQGRRDKLITNLIVDRPSRDSLAIERSEFDQDELNKLAGKTLPQIMAAAMAGTNQAYNEDRRPTADLHIPRRDETALGGLFQMLMLATAVEGRLIGINPYGQPGVEAYKRHMNANLSQSQ